MTVRRVRQLLHTLAAICLMAAAAAVVWSLQPVEIPTTTTRPAVTMPGPSPDSTAVEISEARLAEVWGRRLQGPLRDAVVRTPPQTRPPAPRRQPPPNPRVELLATVIESGQATAIVADSGGRTDIKGVGEKLNLSPAGMTVESIRPDEVTLSFRGQSIRVALKKSPPTKPARGRR